MYREPSKTLRDAWKTTKRAARDTKINLKDRLEDAADSFQDDWEDTKEASRKSFDNYR